MPLETLLVTVVIPTAQRSNLVGRAIASALAQTLTDLEVIVVINGPDEGTFDRLAQITDPRLRVLHIPETGASLARNAGVQAARGEWIALLDDDDEWMPTKLAQQLELAQKSSSPYPIVASKLIARTPKGDFVRPRRFPRSQECIFEYLIARQGLFQGEGLIQTSVIFTRKALLERVPFRQLPKHQDWDWFVQVRQVEGVTIEFVPEPLAIWYLEECRATVSNRPDWQPSLAWIRENRTRVSRRAYAAFVLLEIGSKAAQNRDWHSFGLLLSEAFQNGQPAPIEVLLYFGWWWVPLETRRSLRALLSRTPRSIPHESSVSSQA